MTELSPEHRERLAALADLLDSLPDAEIDLRVWFGVHQLVGLAIASDFALQAWYWMLSPAWRDTDNTPRGAAARIRHLLEHGLPEDWREQMSGEAELCYEVTT